MGWSDYGNPITRSWQVDELLELLRTWYVDYGQVNGGFLHIWAEDGNLSDDMVLPEHRFDEALAHVEDGVERLHAEGYLSRDVTAEMIEKHMRRIIGCWRDMEACERFSAHAWHHGYAQEYLAKLTPWASYQQVLKDREEGRR